MGYQNNLGTYSVLEPYGDPEVYEAAVKMKKQFKVGDIVRVERQWGDASALITEVVESENKNMSFPYHVSVKPVKLTWRGNEVAFATFVSHETNKGNRFMYHMIGPYND